MDNLPDWAVTIITVAVGLSPGLALLSARPIARLLYAMLWPRREGQRTTDLRKPGDRHLAQLPRPTLGDPAASR